MTVLIHAEDKKIEQCGFLFVRKTLCVHAEMVRGGGNRVNLRKNESFITPRNEAGTLPSFITSNRKSPAISYLSKDFLSHFHFQAVFLSYLDLRRGRGVSIFCAVMAGAGMDIKYVAHLARLALTPEEEEKLGAQLGNILHYIEKLNQIGCLQCGADRSRCSVGQCDSRGCCPSFVVERRSPTQRPFQSQRLLPGAENRRVTRN